MKISKIKNKLEELFGEKPKDTTETIKNMLKLIDLLKDKQKKLKSRLELSDDADDKQNIKRKLKLVKKQLSKAEEHIDKLKSVSEE